MNLMIFRSAVMGILFVGCLVGCSSVPTGRYQAFSAANDTVSTQVADTFTRIEKREKDFAVLAAPDQLVSVNTFDLGKASIDTQLNEREAVLKVLVAYAKALDSLAEKDFSTSVDQSSQELAASVRGISGVSPATANIFGTVIDGLAKVTSDSMRKNALKNTMTTGQPALEEIARQFQLDSAKISAYVDQMRDRYIDHVNKARPKYGTWERYKFDSEVAVTLDEFKQINAALSSAALAVHKIPEAHRQILKSLDDKTQSLDALHDVISEAQNLRSFYRALPTK